jgi:SAM-dependent methyltransferase
MTSNPLATAEPWDLVASAYAAGAGKLTAPFSQRAAALAQLQPHMHVLDVAAGPGPLALELAPRVAHITAVDLSPAMVAELRRRAEQQKSANLLAIVCDGQALPLEDASFDAAFSLFGWMFFPDRRKGLAELHRVLKPGAPLVVSSWAPVARSQLMTALFGALRAADPNMPPPVPDPDSLENPDVLARELREANFSDVAVHECTTVMSFGSSDELWRTMASSSAPLALMRKRVGEATWNVRAERAREHLARELGTRPQSLTTTAWLGFGSREKSF